MFLSPYLCIITKTTNDYDDLLLHAAIVGAAIHSVDDMRRSSIPPLCLLALEEQKRVVSVVHINISIFHPIWNFYLVKPSVKTAWPLLVRTNFLINIFYSSFNHLIHNYE